MYQHSREPIEVQDVEFPSPPPEPGSQVSVSGPEDLPVSQFSCAVSAEALELQLEQHGSWPVCSPWRHIGIPWGVYKAGLMLSLLPGNTDYVFQAPML